METIVQFVCTPTRSFRDYNLHGTLSVAIPPRPLSCHLWQAVIWAGISPARVRDIAMPQPRSPTLPWLDSEKTRQEGALLPGLLASAG